MPIWSSWAHHGRRFKPKQHSSDLLHTLHSLAESCPQGACQHASLEPPPSGDYACLLGRIGSAKALPEGKRIHDHIIKCGLDQNLPICNLLLQMYGKCGILEEVHALFDKMHQRDLSSWNFLIRAHARFGQPRDAVLIFEQMKREGRIPNKFIFVSILPVYASQAALCEGKKIHIQIASSGCEADAFVGTALVSMYGKCGSVEGARRMFDKMPERDAVTWNTMIAVYTQHGLAENALEVFNRMLWVGTMPTDATFVSILEACASKEMSRHGKRIHIFVLFSRFVKNIVVETALMNMYGKCGILDDARKIFDNMHERDAVLWNNMIAAYVQNGESKAALHLFYRMWQEEIMLDKFTFVSTLSACASEITLAEGKQIHVLILTSGFDVDTFMENALVNLYGKCGSLEDAWRMFWKRPERDIVSWNAMIAAYIQHEHSSRAFQLFEQMPQEGSMPNKVTLVSIFDLCASQAAQNEGKHLHGRILGTGLELEVAVGNALVNMYGNWGNLQAAQRIFSKMPTRDKVTFMNILSACASTAALREGKEMHAHIIHIGLESDLVVGTALVSMYGKCGSTEDARTVFDKLPERDAVLWTATIAAYAHNGQGKAALQLFEEMHVEGIQGDKVTVVSILDACAMQAALVEGKKMHTHIIVCGFESDIVVETALVNMYGKCGYLEDSHGVFNRMPQRDAVTWTVMIAAYAQHGHAKDSLELFEEMRLEGIIPNEITFVSILSACSHSGLVDEGRRWFRSIKQDYGMAPVLDHYNCMIDLLGRAGRLDEAETMIRDMPIHPTSVTWTTLLCACRDQVDVRRGEWAASHVFELDPDNPSPYIMLSNIYAASGRDQDMVNLIKRAKEKGLMLDTGNDFILVKDSVHQFHYQQVEAELQGLQ